jgi:antitoxin ParD1/3/4
MSQDTASTNTSLHISLPTVLRHYVEERVAKGGYSNPSDYMRELIRRDQRREAQEELERLLLEGLRSGEAKEITETYFGDLRREIEAVIGRKRAQTL